MVEVVHKKIFLKNNKFDKNHKSLNIVIEIKIILNKIISKLILMLELLKAQDIVIELNKKDKIKIQKI